MYGGEKIMKDKLSNKEIEEIKNNEWIILSTSLNNKPRTIILLIFEKLYSQSCLIKSTK